MKRLLYTFWMILAFYSLEAQGWYKFYDQYPSSIANVITQLPDESYVVAGVIDPFAADQLFLAKVEVNGDVNQIKMDYDLRMVHLSTFLHTDDGGLVLLGAVMNPTSDLVVIKFDANLNLEWKTILPSLGSQEIPNQMAIDNDGNYLIHGIWQKSGGISPILARVDTQGSVLWHSSGVDVRTSSSVSFNEDGNIISTGMTLSNPSKVYVSVHDIHSGNDIDVWIYDSSPFEKEEGYEIIPSSNGHMFLVSRYTLYDENFDKILDARIRIREIGANGSIIQQVDQSRDMLPEEYVRAYRLDDGTFTYCFRSHENDNRYYIQLVHLASDLSTELWSREYMDISPEIELAHDFIRTRDGGYMVSGAIAEGGYIPLLLKVDANGIAFTNDISGYVFHDDGNCNYDSGESTLSDWMVEIKKGNEVYYRMSDDNGYYSIAVDTGDYTIRTIPPSDVWSACEPIVVSFDDFFQQETANVGAEPEFDCPVLSVDISIGSLRRCYDRTYTVDYCNLGTVNATDAYIEVEIDSQLVIVGTTHPIAQQDGNWLRFNVGDLAYNECGSFNITVYTPCEVTLGDIHCSTAHIFPDDVCSDVSEWTGATVKVVGECVDDNFVHFEIKNVGDGDMGTALPFNVIEDDMILMTGTYDLNAGETMPVTVPATGGVYRLEAQQVPDYPMNSTPSVVVPGCGGFFDSDYMNWYPLDDDELFYDVSCMENVDSYDPNDKQAEPVGYDTPHYIYPNTDLEYQIQFQNTGTDTAYHVILIDSLSPMLDVSTFREGTSSFPYTLDIIQGNGVNILRFEFKNINLTPFMYDEANSTGFVKFNIAQQKDLPNGSLIENEASIYFDFNERILTNRTYHTVHDDFMPIDLILEGNQHNGVEEEHILNVEVTPNPFIDKALVTIHDLADGETATIRLYSADGKLMRIGTFNSNFFWLERGILSKGVYFYSVIVSSGREYHDKIIIR